MEPKCFFQTEDNRNMICIENEIRLDKCPLTGLGVVNSISGVTEEYDRVYRVLFNGSKRKVRLCGELYEMLTNKSCLNDGDTLYLGYRDDILEKLNSALPFFWNEQNKEGFADFFDKTIHWNCSGGCSIDIKENPNRHLFIKKYVDERLSDYQEVQLDDYSFRKKIILEMLYENHKLKSFDINAILDFDTWTKCYVKNSKELLEEYIEPLISNEYIKKDNDKFRLTEKAIDFIENKENNKQNIANVTNNNITNNNNTTVNYQNKPNPSAPTKRWQIIGVCVAVIMGVIGILFKYFFGN